MPSVPINLKLYNRIKKKIKARSKVWPSAYASGQLVREYKRKGGKYRTTKFGKQRSGKLARWFKEEWVDVCRPKGKSYAKCGRKKSERGKYPYCRPLRRVSKGTPKTVREISKKKLKQMCAKKRKAPYTSIRLVNGKSIRRSRPRKV
jgi:hypothetical protein